MTPDYLILPANLIREHAVPITASDRWKAWRAARDADESLEREQVAVITEHNLVVTGGREFATGSSALTDGRDRRVRGAGSSCPHDRYQPSNNSGVVSAAAAENTTGPPSDLITEEFGTGWEREDR